MPARATLAPACWNCSIICARLAFGLLEGEAAESVVAAELYDDDTAGNGRRGARRTRSMRSRPSLVVLPLTPELTTRYMKPLSSSRS